MIKNDGTDILFRIKIHTSVPLLVDAFAYVTHAVHMAVETYGSLDIVIANAVGNFVVPAAEMSANAWKTSTSI